MDAKYRADASIADAFCEFEQKEASFAIEVNTAVCIPHLTLLLLVFFLLEFFNSVYSKHAFIQAMLCCILF